MIGSTFKNQKDNVIDLYDGYKRIRGNTNDGINLEFLESRVNNLKNEKYILTVAGEVKAGKSTFINALLGVELLPTDVLQSSSAIVEICKANEPYLKVQYADGNEIILNHSESVNEGNVFQRKIKEVCSLSDKYRDLPTTVLDADIIRSQSTLKVTDELITSLEKKSQLNLKDKKELLKEYIENRSEGNIPIEIQIGFPLKWEFDQLRIVDSPGVNAVGGVQDISHEYFKKANAIIFINRIEPIESKSFSDFVNSTKINMSKETLFLVLTHAGLKTEDDVIRLHNEAKRLFKNVIPEEKILVVDSILKLISIDLKNGKSLEQIKRSSKYKAKLIPELKELAEEQNKEYGDIFEEYSQFDKMFEIIDKFSLKAPSLQPSEITEKIKEGYKNQKEQLVDEIDLKKKKKENPQVFEEEIERIKKGLNKIENDIHRINEEINRNYAGRHSDWNNQISEWKVKYPEQIKNSVTSENVRKHFWDALNDVENIISDFSKSLTKEFKKKLEEYGKKFQEEHKITVPKVDLDAIADQAKVGAYKKENVYAWQTEPIWKFWKWFNRKYKVKVSEKDVYDENTYLKNFKNNLKKEFDNIEKDLRNKSKEVLSYYLASFKKEMKEVIKERKSDLDKWKTKKQSNDELISEISELEIKKKSIQPELKRASEILEDLK